MCAMAVDVYDQRGTDEELADSVVLKKPEIFIMHWLIPLKLVNV